MVYVFSKFNLLFASVAQKSPTLINVFLNDFNYFYGKDHNILVDNKIAQIVRYLIVRKEYVQFFKNVFQILKEN